VGGGAPGGFQTPVVFRRKTVEGPDHSGPSPPSPSAVANHRTHGIFYSCGQGDPSRTRKGFHPPFAGEVVFLICRAPDMKKNDPKTGCGGGGCGRVGPPGGYFGGGAVGAVGGD